MLLAAGAEVDKSDGFGATALHAAAVGARPKALKLLLKASLWRARLVPGPSSAAALPPCTQRVCRPPASARVACVPVLMCVVSTCSFAGGGFDSGRR